MTDKIRGAHTAFPTTDNYTDGLTKREYFSVLVLQSLITTGRHISHKDLAENALSIVDELIAALNK
jgi:hypothetical protein